MSEHDQDRVGRTNRYGVELPSRGGTPGRSTVTARMPASARAIARAVMTEMSGVAPDADALIARATESSGHALPGELRSRFEASLGTDLGGVRVHTDSASAEASAALGARAFATGQDVFMGAGQYAPHSSDGAFLLAHEVAHTVQQRGASTGPQMKLEVSSPGDAMEVEADVAATAMLSGLPVSVSSGSGIARQVSGQGAEPRLTPQQQQALTTVQHGGAALRHRSTDDLLGLARTLGAAWAHAPDHSDQRRTIARALVHLYDVFDDHLGDEFAAGHDDGRMAWEFNEFQMIDPWVQDANEPSRARHRRHRRQQPRPAVQPPPAQQQPPQAQSAPAVPTETHPQVDPGQVVTPGSETPHVVTTVVEAGSHVLDFLEMATESFGAGIAGAALGGIATFAAAALTIHAGDALGEAGRETQDYLFSFCLSYAHVMRGEPGLGGRGGSRGAQVAQQLRARLAQQYGDLSPLATRRLSAYYIDALLAIHTRVRAQLRAAAEPVLHEQASPWADAVITGVTNQGEYYRQHHGP